MKILRHALLVILATIALGIGVAAAQPKVADVVAIKGTAFVTSGGKVQTVRPGQALHQGDQLHAPVGCGIRIRFTDGSTMALGENSIITIHTYTQQGNDRSAILEMVSGIFRAVVSPVTGNSVFAVRTPTAVAAVRSTDWMLAAKEDLTEVFVSEGFVAVRNLNPTITSEVILTNGDGTDVKTNEAPLSARKWGPPRIRAFQERTTVN